MIIVVETVLAVVGHIEVRPAIVVVVADRNSESPTLIGDSCLGCNICEGSVVIIVEEHSLWRGLLTLQSRNRGAVEQVDVEPAVIVIVEQRYTRAWSLDDALLFGSTGATVKFVETGCLRDIGEHHRSAIDKPACRDRPGLGVLPGRMCDAGRDSHL